MDRKWVIYTLSHPHTGEVRYVGVTHGKTRLAEHIYATKRERNHRACWIRALQTEGLRPNMVVIEEGVGASWNEREKFWIADFRTRGVRLTNSTDGGEGTLGWRPTAEQRARIAERTKAAHTGRVRTKEARANMRAGQLRRIEEERSIGHVRKMPPRTYETLARMSAAQKGRKASPSARDNMSKAHSNVSSSTREKLRQAVLSRPVEQRQAFAHNQRGVPKSEETKHKMSEAARQRWARKRLGKEVSLEQT